MLCLLERREGRRLAYEEERLLAILSDADDVEPPALVKALRGAANTALATLAADPFLPLSFRLE